MEKKLVKCEPCITDDGIYAPINEYRYEDTATLYRLLISKEMFIEAYNRWIKDGGNDATNSV